MQTSSWQRLEKRFEKEKTLSIKKLLEEEPSRKENLMLNAAGLTVDFSKQLASQECINDLVALAQECSLEMARSLLFDGAKLNHTEHRSALHGALRSGMREFPEYQSAVQHAFDQIKHLSDRIRAGEWPGHNNLAITDVVNIGIGGSDLGPRMVCDTLKPQCSERLGTHFAANIDPSDLDELLDDLNPDTTLFVICSKTFSTLETRENALRARRWLEKSGAQGEKLQRHFIAVSTNIEEAQKFGVASENILPMWDWIGGRYSLWSTIGFSIACAIGYEAFLELIEGGAEMDQHFKSAPLEKNIPTLMGLLDIWYVNFWGCQSQAVLPYAHRLKLFPEYLQQLTMESNGKSVDRAGHSINYQTSPVFWGVVGTLGQHSFHQMLHQGTRFIPVDFILPLQTTSQDKEQHQHLVANCLAQAQALLEGKPYNNAKQESLKNGLSNDDADFLASHRQVPGNRPSTMIGINTLSPRTLGALIACYEHRVFVSSVIWNINAFDQWGVELGKQLSKPLFDLLSKDNKEVSEKEKSLDSSTAYWIDQYQKLNRPS